MTLKGQHLYSAALALMMDEAVHIHHPSAPAHGLELIARWSTEKLKKEYELIQAKESSMSRRERDYIVQEYERRTKS